MAKKLTQEEYIEKAEKAHGTEHYDYSKVIYINGRKEVDIFCNIHKVLFPQIARLHLLGSGCKQCGIEKSAKSRTYDNHIFIANAKKVHGDSKYDYSKTIYINSKEEVKIICHAHGAFLVTPNDHISKKSGCPICARGRITKAVQERYKDVGKEHLELAKKVHNNIYDYSKVIYTGCNDKVIIGCSKHGDFKMLLDNHATQKQGCDKCGKESMAKISSLKLDDFISRSIKKHGDLYSYDNIILKNSSSVVQIFCKKCKKYFPQQAKIHMAGSGCTTCQREKSAIERALTTEEFIFKSQQVHGTSKYDYSMSKYVDNRTQVRIKCNDCNYIFKSIAGDHYSKASGCPKCANLISNPEKEIVEFIESLGIKVIENVRRIILNPHTGRGRELDIFLPEHNIAIEFNGIYFHSSKYKDKNFHREKTDACLEKGIFLLHIFEDDFNTKKDLIFARIKQLIGKSESILSKQTKLKTIDVSLASKFLNYNHIHGATKATFYYGLFHNNKLVSVTGFLKGRKDTKNSNKYELVRHATNRHIVDSLDEVLKEFKNNFSETLYTFCDNSFYDYQDYIKVGFSKITKTLPDYKYVVKSKRENKSQWKKQDIKIKLPDIYSDNKTIKEMMLEAKIYKIYDCGKTRLELSSLL